jgi:acyl carrier protein
MIEKKTFLEIISKTLKIKYSDLNMNLEIKNIDNWDSLATVNILINLKKNKKLNVPKNFNSFKNIQEFYDQINKNN